MRSFIVIGAGGHAKVVIDALFAAGQAVIGATDQDRNRHGTAILSVPVLGDDHALESYERNDIAVAMGLGIPAIGSSAARAALAAKLIAAGFEFPAVVHPSAVIGLDVKLGAGAQVMAGALVQPGSTIGDFAIINTGASVDHDCRIGAHTHIAPRATLAGGVTVGARSLVGVSACITPNVQVGSDCLVPAGSIVTRALLDGARVSRGQP